jgi:metal-responsive CopG/Arc/MetJ family transcriptional regulator
MARTPNPSPTSFLKLSTTEQVVKRLDKLVAKGLWGKTRSEVAESLVREKLRQLELPFKTRKSAKAAPKKTAAAKRRAS